MLKFFILHNINMGIFLSLADLPSKFPFSRFTLQNFNSADFEHGNFPVFGSMMRSYMKYNTVIYGFYRAKKISFFFIISDLSTSI